MSQCNGRECRHTKWPGGGHCADMACPNYVNKCPVHSIPPRDKGDK